MSLSKEKFNKYLYIKNNVVYTKRPAKIYLDLSEYKNINEEFDISDESGSDSDIEEAETSSSQTLLEVPGFFTLEFPEDGDSIQFYFPYNVFLFETEETNSSSTEITINYSEDEAVFQAKFKKVETDVKVLDKLFENGIKYLSNNPGFLIYNIWKQVAATMNVPWHHFEVIVSQLYGVQENGVWIPVRLSKDQKYCKQCALSTKQAAHLLTDDLGFLYGYSNDAILTSITKKKQLNKNDSFMEKLIKGDL